MGTNKRHYLTQSIPSLQSWMSSKQHAALLSFVHTAVFDILR